MAVEVPPQEIIDTLRNEIAQLNDARLALVSQVQFQEKVIEGLTMQIHEYEHRLNEDHEHETGG